MLLLIVVFLVSGLRGSGVGVPLSVAFLYASLVYYNSKGFILGVLNLDTPVNNLMPPNASDPHSEMLCLFL